MKEIKTEKDTKHTHLISKRKRLEIVVLAAITVALSTICGFAENSTMAANEVSSFQTSSDLVTSQTASTLSAADESQVPAAASALISSVSEVPADSSAVTSSEGSSSQPSKIPAPPQYTYDKDGLKVTATLLNPADIPAGAQLSASRITQGSDPERFAQYLALLQENTGVKTDLPFAAYDISFLLNGQEIEPAGGAVTITLEDTAAQVKPAQDSKVFHVVEEESAAPKLQEVPVDEGAAPGSDAVAFKADSFSAFLLLQDNALAAPAVSAMVNYKTISSTNDTFTNTSYYNAGSPLGIAGSFHIVAFDTATLKKHTNGNILAKNLNAETNFGTDNLNKELSYVQNYSKVWPTSASSDSHVLVVGSGNTVQQESGGRFIINGITINSPHNVWQDANTNTLPFIDLNQVKTQVTTISESLAAIKKNVNIDDSQLKSNQGSAADKYITLSAPDAIGVYNINATLLSNENDSSSSSSSGKYTYLGVNGFQSGKSGTVIINVDCAGVTGTLYVPISKINVDGNWLTLDPKVTPFVNGRVIWNFINITPGLTIDTCMMYATLLAPDATIDVTRNLNGTVIGKNVIIDAESHRDDFVGKLPVNVTVNKIWLDNAGNPITGSTVTDKTVTLQLYQSSDGGVTKTAYGSSVTLNGATGWTYSWVNLLPGFLYSVQETGITLIKGNKNVTGNYLITYSSAAGVTDGELLVYNQYVYTLPATGGVGSAPYILCGLLLMAGALYVYIRLGRFRKGSIPPDSG